MKILAFFFAFFCQVWQELQASVAFYLEEKFTLHFAKVKYGEMIADLRGKINGTVHSKNTYGQYMRNKVTPVNPKTTYQSSVRTLMAIIAQTWRTLTQAQRDQWNSMSTNFSQTDVFGSAFTYTGFNLYGQINRYRQEVGQALLATPPMPVSVFGLTSLSLAIDIALSQFQITFAPAISASTSVIVYATPGLSAGKQFVKSEFRKIGVLTVADVSPKELFAMYTAKFGVLPPAGAKAFVKLLPVNTATGIAGVALETVAISA